MRTILFALFFIPMAMAQWNPVEPVLPGVIFRSVTFSSAGNGIIAGTRGAVLYSSDSGESWNQVESGTDKNIEQVFFQNSSNAWGCGEEGLLLKSTNGGLSWSSFVLDSGYNLSGITFKQQTGWVTGYNSSFESAVFKTTNNGESWQKVFIDSAFTYYSVYFAD